MRSASRLLLTLSILFTAFHTVAADKPKLTFDEFFNYVETSSVKISPDGRSVAIVTNRADWKAEKYRKDLWLYREGAGLVQLTRSGQDSQPEWSPDGKWIAFVTGRKVPLESEPEPGAGTDDKKNEA